MHESMKAWELKSFQPEFFILVYNDYTISWRIISPSLMNGSLVWADVCSLYRIGSFATWRVRPTSTTSLSIVALRYVIKAVPLGVAYVHNDSDTVRKTQYKYHAQCSTQWQMPIVTRNSGLGY
ncbi:hypothetical protein LZ31DRAFT_385524 [Colletotrichum somersetense]|nr:hypothetical protein LZ31DRAFT_385524 [Colletotrichum somersetense]